MESGNGFKNFKSEQSFPLAKTLLMRLQSRKKNIRQNSNEREAYPRHSETVSW